MNESHGTVKRKKKRQVTVKKETVSVKFHGESIILILMRTNLNDQVSSQNKGTKAKISVMTF